MIGGIIPGAKIFIVTGITDMRKSFNGLESIVENELKMATEDGHIFCFSNRRRDRLKILVFDGSGLWVCAKRLEKGTFRWPGDRDKYVTMTGEELTMLLAGIDIQQAERRRWHKKSSRKQSSFRKAEEDMKKLIAQY